MTILTTPDTCFARDTAGNLLAQFFGPDREDMAAHFTQSYGLVEVDRQPFTKDSTLITYAHATEAVS